MKKAQGFHKPGRQTAPSKSGSIGKHLLLKNSQLLAFNKPAGLAVQTAKADAPNLYSLACAYAKRDLYLIHRIDQPASGIVLFARHKNSVQRLQQQFASRSVGRTYLAVVEALPEVAEGELTHLLARDGRTNKSAVVDADHPEAKDAILSWRQVGATDRYPILEISLQTGRHHQIRAQLAAVGAPIHGDVKYGARRANDNRGIHLHAWQLEFAHPISKEKIALTAPLPTEDALWDAVRDQVSTGKD